MIGYLVVNQNFVAEGRGGLGQRLAQNHDDSAYITGYELTGESRVVTVRMAP